MRVLGVKQLLALRLDLKGRSDVSLASETTRGRPWSLWSDGDTKLVGKSSPAHKKASTIAPIKVGYFLPITKYLTINYNMLYCNTMVEKSVAANPHEVQTEGLAKPSESRTA